MPLPTEAREGCPVRGSQPIANQKLLPLTGMVGRFALTHIGPTVCMTR